MTVSSVVVKLRWKFDGCSSAGSPARCMTHTSGLMIVTITEECLEEQNNTGSCLMAPGMKACLFGAQFAAGLGRLEAGISNPEDLFYIFLWRQLVVEDLDGLNTGTAVTDSNLHLTLCFLFFPHLAFSYWLFGADLPPFAGAVAAVHGVTARLMFSHSHLIFCTISRLSGPCPDAGHCFVCGWTSFM